MRQYERYKGAGDEWLVEVPHSWKVVKLKYSARINPAKRNYDFERTSETEVVFLPMEKISEEGVVVQDTRKAINEVSTGFTYFERDDVLVAKITPCFENGKAALLDNLETQFGFGSTEFHVLRKSDEITKEFLYYITRTHIFKKNGEAFMTGSAGQKRVPQSFIEQLFIGLPPLKEQTAIANYLDEKTAQIDTLIEKKQKLIELLKEERKAIINEAVSGEGKNWDWKKLKYVARLKSGSGITSDDITPEGEYPVYGGNGLRGYCSEFTHEGEYVLIGRQGALCGNINYAKGKFFASEHAVVVDILDGSRTLWLGELLRNMNLNQYSIASAQPGLSVERIQNISIPVPSKEEQDYIVRLIQAGTSRVDITVCSVQKEIELLQEYKSALISEVVTGKVKVI